MPKKVEITAKVIGKKGTPEEGQVLAEFSGVASHCYGETAEESIKLCGADVVNSKFIAQDVITLQGKVRTALAAGMAPADVQKNVVDAHKPGVAAVRQAVDPVTATINKFNAMPDGPEKQKALKEFMAKLQGK